MTFTLYLLPCQLYVITLAVFGLRRLKTMPPRPHFHLLGALLICAAVLSALSVAEDLLTILPYGLHTELTVEATRDMKSRNFCECVLDILLLCGMSYAGIRILVSAFERNKSSVPVQPPKDMQTELDLFAEDIGLSKREKEVLSLMLENKSGTEISEELIISQGTVKSHTHNIYQKAVVPPRVLSPATPASRRSWRKS